MLAEWVAGGGGTLLALVWTAGFMPEFLQPASASVLLSKPVPRWALLTGKYIGVLTFAAIQVMIFIVGTWAALGLATGYWVPRYLLGIPLLLVHFAAVYSFSVLVATITGATLACVFGSVGFWAFCWGINYGRHCLLALQSSLPPLHPVLGGLVEAGYWILPKPADMGMILHQLLDAGNSFRPLAELQRVQDMGRLLSGAVCAHVAAVRRSHHRRRRGISCRPLTAEVDVAELARVPYLVAAGTLGSPLGINLDRQYFR